QHAVFRRREPNRRGASQFSLTVRMVPADSSVCVHLGPPLSLGVPAMSPTWDRGEAPERAGAELGLEHGSSSKFVDLRCLCCRPTTRTRPRPPRCSPGIGRTCDLAYPTRGQHGSLRFCPHAGPVPWST